MKNNNSMQGSKLAIKNIFFSYFSIFFTLVTGLLYTPWLIRELGQSEYAIYSIVISLMSYVTVDFGLSAVVSRFIAKYLAAGEREKIKGFIGIVLKVYIIITSIAFVVLVALFFVIENIYQGLTVEEIEKLKVVYIIMAVMTVFSIPALPLNGIYTAHGRVYNNKIFDLISKLLIIVFVCISLLCGKGLYYVVLINALVTVSINIIKLLYIRKAEHLEIDITDKDKGIVKNILSFSAWMTIAMIADKFFFTIEPSLLAAFSNSREVAIFGVAAQIEGYVLMFADALNGIFLPKVAVLANEDNANRKLTNLMISVGKLQLFVVAGLFVAIAVLGKEFISLFFGSEYIASYYAVLIILCPCVIHMTQGIGMEVLYVTNKVKYRALSYIVGAIINVIVTVLLVPSMGAIGAAIGIATGFLVGHEIIMNIVYSKVLNLGIGSFFKNCHLKMVLPMTITLIVGFLVTKALPNVSFLLLIIKGGICAVCYFVSSFIFFIGKDEKNQLLSFVKQKLLRK